MATKTFRLFYNTNSMWEVEVERDEDITLVDLLESITRDELIEGSEVEGGWDSLKDAWRSDDTAFILDKDGDDCFPSLK